MNRIEHNTIKIAKTIEVLNKLNLCIKEHSPFSLVRFGDGTIKAIHAFLNKDIYQLTCISQQEGIPIDVFEKFITFWTTSANCSDYIDCPEVYFSGKFWERTKSIKKKKMSDKTLERLHLWKELYEKIGIQNINYCNPEVNFLSCLLGKFGQKTLPDILQNKKICCITSRSDVKKVLAKYNINTDIIKIAGKEQNQFHRSFNRVLESINDDANKYDLWLIAAGELGRIYPGLIKTNGGRALDVGSLIDYWVTGEIPSRLQPYLKPSYHPLKLELTDEAKEYSKYI